MSHGASRRHLLLVDDEPVAALPSVRALEGAGYHVQTVTTGTDAVAKASADRLIDLVLMDLELGPDCSGYEAAKRILTDHDVPIVFFSSHNDAETISRLSEIANYGYVSKSSGEHVLLHTVATALELSETRRLLAERERSYHAFYERAPLPYQSIGGDGRIIDVNMSWCETFGYERDDVLGRPVTEFLTSASAELLTTTLENHLFNGCGGQTSLTFIAATGKHIRVQSDGLVLRDAEGRFLRTHCILRDITDELRYRTIFEDSPIGFFRSTTTGRFLEVNPALAQMLGYDSPAAVMESVEDIAEQIYADPTEREPIVRMVRGTRTTATFQVWYRRKDGERWLGDLTLRVARDEDAQPEYLEGFVQDITERHLTEERIRASEAALSTILESLPLGLFLHDLDGNILLVNRATTEMTGYTREELLSLRISDIDQASVTRDDRREIWLKHQDGTSASIQSKHRRKDGSEYTADISITPVTMNGEPRIVGMAMDITEREKAERILRDNEARYRQLHEEKELILKEVHHRIKNDMAIIKSLLSLQRGTTREPLVAGALAEAQNRVEIMQGIYRLLYQGEDFRSVNLAGVITDLLIQVRQTHQTRTRVDVQHQIDDVEVPTKIAFPLGIIINELVTNVFKYAFSDRERGSVHVSVSRTDQIITAVVHDDGEGLPASVAAGDDYGFGLTLVSGLIQQYHGALDLSGPPGTTATITLPVPTE